MPDTTGERDATNVDLAPHVLDELRRSIREEVDAGLQAAEIAVARDGRIVFAEAYGAANDDTPLVIMSPSKTVQDSALWLLIADGAIEPDQPVARHLPEFGTHGKETVTLSQIMTHTGGFPNAPLDWPEWSTREARLAAYGRWELEYEPGTRYTYHPAAGSWVLADLMHAVTGHDHREVLRERVFTPLGLRGVSGVSLGEPVAEQAAVLPHVFAVSPEAVAALPPQFSAGGAIAVPGGLALPEGRAVGFPGAGCVGTATGLALLYQAYLHNPGELWDPAVLNLATHEAAIELPARWDRPIRRSLSMFLAGDPSARAGSEADFFGAEVSSGAFGHDGLGGNFVWADPETGLSVAFLTNTITFMPWEHHERAARLATLAARLLG
jgi:CubicO group peptidase (beta-lactamase class C family)